MTSMGTIAHAADALAYDPIPKHINAHTNTIVTVKTGAIVRMIASSDFAEANISGPLST